MFINPYDPFPETLVVMMHCTSGISKQISISETAIIANFSRTYVPFFVVLNRKEVY
jgi:hypothetical protein